MNIVWTANKYLPESPTLKNFKSKRFACSLCDKTFVQKRSLKNHIKEFHEEDGGKELLNNFENLHKYEKEEFKCSMCERKFEKEISMRRHFKSSGHYNVNSCPVCYKSFGRKGGLKMHFRHSGHFDQNVEKISKEVSKEIEDKPFLCAFCDRRFSLETSMKSIVVWKKKIPALKC